MPVSKINNGNGVIIKFGDEKPVKKSEKSKKLFKSQKIPKFKILSKNRDLFKIDIKDIRSSFLTLNTKTVFNYL